MIMVSSTLCRKHEAVAIVWTSLSLISGALHQQAQGIKGNRGKRYVVTRKEIRSNRERYGVPLVVVSRPHKSGRAPLYLGAPAQIYPSGRSKPIFIP